MRTMSPETVRDAMVPEPTTLAAGASAQEAGRCFADSGEVRAIFVTDDGGRLLGVVTRKTLVREVVAAGLDPSAVNLREIAEPPNFTLDAGLELESAFRFLEEQDLERVPVVEEDGRLVGVLSGAVVREDVAVYPRAVVLLETQVERGDARDRRRHADRVLRVELREERAGRLDARLHVFAVPLGEAPRAHRQARPEAVEGEFGRATADVDQQRRRPEIADAPLGQLGLLVAREQPCREPVAPLDLAEERLPVLRVADGARRNEQRPLGAERLGGAAVVGEGVTDTGDRDGERRRRASTPSPRRVIRVSRCSSSTRPS